MNLDPQSYVNRNRNYDVGYTENYQNCHLFDGDEFSLAMKGLGGVFQLTYIPVASITAIPADYAKLVAFWASATLKYDPTLGVITGFGLDQFGGHSDVRMLSIAIDRSRANPSVVHIYVASRGAMAPSPDDGSATGTGK